MPTPTISPIKNDGQHTLEPTVSLTQQPNYKRKRLPHALELGIEPTVSGPSRIRRLTNKTTEKNAMLGIGHGGVPTGRRHKY